MIADDDNGGHFLAVLNTSSTLIAMRIILLLIFLLSSITNALLIPATPEKQTQFAIQSLRVAIQNEGRRRLYVDYLIPLPPETTDADIDPWPGGLAQQYPYATDILTEILQGVVEEPTDACNAQVISASDCCGFFIQESKAGPKNDVAALLFPGVDQLNSIEDIDKMVSDERTLILFNKQFQRPADFGFGNKERCNKVVFDRFSWGFAFQELACRGEDVKLLYETPNWQSIAILDEDVDLGRREIEVLPPQKIRPTYEELEKRINKVLPEPLWMRKMGEVQTKGFKFQRGQKQE